MAARTGRAALVGLIGDPIGHSLSPLIHEHWIARYGIDAAYLPWRQHTPDLSTLMPALEALDLRGFNVTVPYKEDILAYVDPDAVARRIGAVNTVCCDASGWTGHNTDAAGFLASIGGRNAVRGKYVRLLGAGGAARACSVALADAGAAEISFSNRRQDRAEQLVSQLRGEATRFEILAWEKRENGLEACDLLVNTTSLGMQGKEPLAMTLDGLPPTARVVDIVYAPRETALLQAARARGLETVGGLGMLLGQASAAFALWFGIEPEIDEVLHQRLDATLAV